MGKKKAHPEHVIPECARQAMSKCQPGQRAALFSQYILLHYRGTGKLAPGCDALDLYAWYEQNMPQELDAITTKRKEPK